MPVTTMNHVSCLRKISNHIWYVTSMLINKARHFIGKSNYIFLPLPLNEIKKLFCPHGWNIMSMWQVYFVYMYKYLEKIPLMLTKMLSVHTHNS
jgi:hypothetical protein